MKSLFSALQISAFSWSKESIEFVTFDSPSNICSHCGEYGTALAAALCCLQDLDGGYNLDSPKSVAKFFTSLSL